MNEEKLSQLLKQALQAHRQGQFEAALAIYHQVLENTPEHSMLYAEAQNFLGALKLQLGEYEQALTHLKRATELGPAQSSYWNNLGLAYHHLAQWPEAVQALKRALQRKNHYPEAQLNLAHVLRFSQDFETALQHYLRALQQGAAAVPCMYYIATLLDEMGRLCEACMYYQKILSLDNYHADSWESLAANALNRGEIEQALQCYHNASQLKPDSAVLYSGYLFTTTLSSQVSAEARAERLHTWNERFAEPLAQQSQALKLVDFDPERRLRVGYLCSHFSGHSSSHISRALFGFSNPQNIEIFAYNAASEEKGYDPFFKEKSQHWRDVATLSDFELANLFREDALDILVDLNGHTRGHRLLAMAQRCAPIQVTGLCFLASSGQKNMDVILADRYIMPPERAAQCWEQVHFLDSLFCWFPPNFDLEPGSLPELKNGYITFGSGNRWFKHTPEVLALWQQILVALPNSRLVIKTPELDDPTMCQMIQERFQAQGVAPERLILRGRTDKLGHFQNYQDIDIALDPFPYDGGITTLDTLWMGVPVIAMNAGQRSAVTILNQLHMPEFLAQDASEYLNLALKLAADRESRAALRQNLRSRLEQSLICQPQVYTAGVESLYRRLWRDWVEEQKDTEIRGV